MSCIFQSQQNQSQPKIVDQIYWCHVCRIQKRTQIPENFNQELHCRTCSSPMEKIDQNSQDQPQNFNYYQSNNYQEPINQNQNQNQQQNHENTQHQRRHQNPFFIPFFPGMFQTFIFFDSPFRGFQDIDAEQQKRQEEILKQKIQSLEEQTMRNDRDDKTCSVCLENFKKDQKIMLLPCNHTFHKDCVMGWFEQKKDSCPCCRQSI